MEPRELPRGTVTLLFTDIEGSTRMLQELGRDAYVRALTAHRRLLRDAFTAHDGVEVEMQGDSFHFSFPYARDAVAAAVAGQRALQEHAWESQPISVRIGLHTGEPIQAEGLYAGLDVHRAARVMSAGHGGQVLVSQQTAELVDGELPAEISLLDLGEHRLKDLSAPQRLYQACAAGITAEFPRLKTLAGTHTNLPVQPTALVGRTSELAEIAEMLARSDVRLVTLSGPGGSGKTRLALQAAADAADRFPDGVFWVSLAAIPSQELVPAAIARALDVREQADEPPAVTLGTFLASRRVLLLLDNFEHVLEARALLAELLAVAPEFRLLVTSRTALELSSEHVFDVPPLREDEAVDLFVERARQVGARLGPDDAVVAVCNRLDRLPLALELAAAHARVLEPQALLHRLERRLPLLKGGASDLPSRQQTLYGTIAWSHDLLEDEERTLFRRMSVFAGSFTLESAEAVGGTDLWLLESLVAKSLVRRWGSGRLGLLETIHEFAAEQLAAAGEEEALRDAHARHYLEVAEALEPHLSVGAQRVESMDRLGADRENVRAALHWFEQAHQGEELLRLATAMWRFWMGRDPFGSGRYWLERGLDLVTNAPAELRARAYEGLGVMCYFASGFETGDGFTRQARDLFAAFGDVRGTVETTQNLGVARGFRGDIERASALIEEARSLARTADNAYLIALTSESLAAMEVEGTGNHERALQLLGEATQLWEQLGDAGRAAGTAQTLGLLLLGERRYDAAADEFVRCLAVADALPQRHDVALAFSGLAAAVVHGGDAASGARLLGAAEAFLAAIGGSWEAAEGVDERAMRESTLASARDQLGPGAFESAYAAGAELTLEESIKETLETFTPAVTRRGGRLDESLFGRQM